MYPSIYQYILQIYFEYIIIIINIDFFMFQVSRAELELNYVTEI